MGSSVGMAVESPDQVPEEMATTLGECPERFEAPLHGEGKQQQPQGRAPTRLPQDSLNLPSHLPFFATEYPTKPCTAEHVVSAHLFLNQ